MNIIIGGEEKKQHQKFISAKELISTLEKYHENMVDSLEMLVMRYT